MKFIKRLLISLVAVVVLFYVVLFGTMTYQMSRDPVMYIDDVEVQYVIDWLGTRTEDVSLLDSHRPPANWAGDYEKIFALRVDEATISEALRRPGVVAGNEVTSRIRKAVRFAMIFTKKLQWFPVEEKILSPELYVSQIRIVEQGGYTDAADLLVIHPQRQIVYFVAAKM